MYTSDYLTRAGYATPSDVGQRSRLCLSCHDGTVAVGSVYTVRAVTQTSPIAMSGVDAFGKMPGTAAGYLGTDLRDDHPVSIKYDTGINITFGSGTRTMELNATAPPINPKPYTGVKLYGTAAGSIKGYVECTSCHDPHNDTNAKFLVISNTSGALCTTCHSKTGWTGSIHQTSTRAINNPGGETQLIPGATVAAAGCMACHKNHSGFGTSSLLRKTEENTCFNGTSTSCHGASGAKNIATVLGRARAHPVATSAKHKNLDVLYYADLGTGNRHAECYDCHNPHQAKNLPQRVATASWYPASVTGASNLLSNSGPLTGVTGV
ncbi:MAG: cytochrome C, partial [Proteobacteria bacterium]|nr:cytochrome C [Pseudomonadota bacterium]